MLKIAEHWCRICTLQKCLLSKPLTGSKEVTSDYIVIQHKLKIQKQKVIFSQNICKKMFIDAKQWSCRKVIFAFMSVCYSPCLIWVNKFERIQVCHMEPSLSLILSLIPTPTHPEPQYHSLRQTELCSYGTQQGSLWCNSITFGG